MEWLFFVGVIVIFMFIGAVFSLQNRSRLADLLREIELLRRQVNIQGTQIDRLKALLKDAPKSSHSAEFASAEPADELPQEVTRTDADFQVPTQPPIDAMPSDSTQKEDAIAVAPATDSTQPGKEKTPEKAKTPFNFERFIKGNGLLWLGGIVLSIGGIFLARYSIEAGLFPPYLRVLSGGVFGLILVIAAEYLARNKERFNIHSPYVSAALASGGVITCYSIVMVAYDFYAFISPQIAFALLAAVSLSATSLSLRFGPLLAWLGIIGAYAVPALVSTDSNNVIALLIYTAIISMSAIWVSQSVKQNWLWWLSFIAHFLWSGIALSIADNSHFMAYSLFTIASIYLYVLSDVLGWNMQTKMHSPLPIKTLLMPRKEHLGVILPTLCMGIFITTIGGAQEVIFACMLLSALFLYLPTRHSALDTWPFLALAFSLYGFTLLPAPQTFADNLFPFRGGYLYIQIAAIVSMAYSLMMLRHHQRPAYLILLVLAPVSLYGLSYALSPDQASQYLYPVWAIELSMIAIASSVFAARVSPGLIKVTLTILANACVTLCLTMLLDAATLSLAIAVQIASMSFLSRKYRVVLPDWLYKTALLIVLLRLTLAPWMDEYAGEQILGVHWTLLIYPTVLGTLWLSRHYNPSESFKVWAEGAFIHVLALFITTETSYLLVGEYPQFFDLDFKQASLLALNWLVLAGTYLWRAKISQSSGRIYRLFAGLLSLGALLIHLDVSVAGNPFFANVSTGEGWIVNWLLVLWALPVLVLTAMHYLRLVPPKLHLFSVSWAGYFSFLYVNGLIRGIYNQGNLLLRDAMQQAELYTYSIVWLLIATAMVFFGQYAARVKISNLGFAILAVVLLKAFLVDMGNLEGLYRAISFIGLGLSLVGIGWLFQKLNHDNRQSTAEGQK